MVGLLLVLILAFEAFSSEVLDRCEIRHRKCVFDCTQKFPLDKEKRRGCRTRCDLEKGLCKVKKGVEGAVEDLKRFLEGFSEGG